LRGDTAYDSESKESKNENARTTPRSRKLRGERGSSEGSSELSKKNERDLVEHNRLGGQQTNPWGEGRKQTPKIDLRPHKAGIAIQLRQQKEERWGGKELKNPGVEGSPRVGEQEGRAILKTTIRGRTSDDRRPPRYWQRGGTVTRKRARSSPWETSRSSILCGGGRTKTGVQCSTRTRDPVVYARGSKRMPNARQRIGRTRGGKEKSYQTQKNIT